MQHSLSAPVTTLRFARKLPSHLLKNLLLPKLTFCQFCITIFRLRSSYLLRFVRRYRTPAPRSAAESCYLAIIRPNNITGRLVKENVYYLMSVFIISFNCFLNVILVASDDYGCQRNEKQDTTLKFCKFCFLNGIDPTNR